jgi:hypothetical protein
MNQETTIELSRGQFQAVAALHRFLETYSERLVNEGGVPPMEQPHPKPITSELVSGRGFGMVRKYSTELLYRDGTTISLSVDMIFFNGNWYPSVAHWASKSRFRAQLVVFEETRVVCTVCGYSISAYRSQRHPYISIHVKCPRPKCRGPLVVTSTWPQPHNS